MYNLIIDGFLIESNTDSSIILSSLKTLSYVFIGFAYEIKDETNTILMKGIINKGKMK